jgi:hypothetical protein
VKYDGRRGLRGLRQAEAKTWAWERSMAGTGEDGKRSVSFSFLFFFFLFFLFLFLFAKSLLYAEETKAGKYVKLDGEGGRKEGNDPAWWPLSEQGSWTKRRETDLTQRERAYRPICQT